jgi:hypothetical protein
MAVLPRARGSAASGGKDHKDLSGIAARLREELVVTLDDPLQARARAGGIAFEADAEAEPPYRLYGFRAYPVGSRVTDARVAAPPTSSSGAVPAVAAETAARGFAELGLAGVVLAGGAPGGADWAIARGWAELDRAEPLRPVTGSPPTVSPGSSRPPPSCGSPPRAGCTSTTPPTIT